MNGKSFCEFPDAVVAAYLDQVRRLSVAQFVALNLPATRLVSWKDPTTWWLAPIATWMWVGQAFRRWFMRRLGIAGCHDSDALREYNIFWAQLALRGSSPIGEAHIALGLQQVRFRHVMAEAPQNYAKHMGAFVPPSSIGWTVHEASA